MVKVLFVCLGNICRSPMAHGLLRSEAQKRGVHLEIDSCGTSNYHAGEHPDTRAIAKMAEKGIDISDLTSRPLNVTDYANYDHILVMDSENLTNAKSLAPSDDAAKKVQLFMNYAGETNCNVPDPYFGSVDGFEHVYQMLSKATNEFLEAVCTEKSI